MTEEQAPYEVSPNKEIKGPIDNLSRKEIKMTEITITSTFMKDPGNAEKPTVQIGMSEFPYEEAKRDILGPYLTSQAEIDNQIDDLIRQLEEARKEAKNFLESKTL